MPKKLVSLGSRTPEERREIARKGGKASVARRRELKTMRQIAEAIGTLKIDVSLPDGTKQKACLDVALILEQYKKAVQRGDTKAATFLAKLRGEITNIQQVNLSNAEDIIGQLKSVKTERQED